MLRQLFRTKSLDTILAESGDPQHQLKRSLGAFDVVMLGIGAIVGAGIFATIGTAAAGDASRAGAGPALILSFVVTGIACGFAALCYAEFAAMVPISGSAYTYAYATLGELIAWIIGWDLIIEYAVGNVAVAISWGNYFKTLVAPVVAIPDWLSTDYRTAAHIPGLLASAPHIFGVPIVFNILAFGIVALITVLLVIGIRESATVNSGMVILKLIVLAFFILLGWSYTKAENWHPFAPNGWAGIQAGAAIVFFAYIGFDAVSTVAEEVRNPARDLPIGIVGSLIICTIIYIVVAAVFTGIIPYNVLVKKLATEQAEPLTMALQYANIERLKGLSIGLVAFGSVVAHTAVLLVFQLGQPRIFFSMARDGLLPPSFAKVHPRFRTPHVTTILTGVAVGVCAMFTSIDEMVDLTNIGTLFAFVLVCIGILILRKRDPNRPRSFKTPWVPLVPILGVLSCAYLALGLPRITWIRFALWLAVGIVIYMSYGFKRSGLVTAEVRR
ncbi:MAG TPA: amino acid permease [Vicinamibacterales bacterium]|nr:amino acid permease [Vicinamibacterales bacterium]